MYPRVEYEMTQEQLDAILDACKPTPVMFLGGGIPIGGTPQENANHAWRSLGEKLGFDYMTVQPIASKGQRFFTAVPSETEPQRAERIEREAAETKRKNIERLQAEIAERRAGAQ